MARHLHVKAGKASGRTRRPLPAQVSPTAKARAKGQQGARQRRKRPLAFRPHR
jgi:hypothetical protein